MWDISALRHHRHETIRGAELVRHARLRGGAVALGMRRRWCVIQGVVDGLAFGALVPMVVSWHTATLRPSCGSARTTAVPDNYGRHPEPSGHMCGIEQARAAAPASPAATGGCLLHHCCSADCWLLLLAATTDLYAQPSQQAHGHHQPGV